jgi:metallo-beta-lactamase family protein
MVELIIQDNGKSKRMIFSGDMGQWNRPLVRDPSVFEQADYIIMESTYGNRNHEDPADVETLLCNIINDTVGEGGNVIIPTFAIERAQELMFHLSRLIRQDRIPYLMTFLDSPMAIDVTEVFLHNQEYLDEETKTLFRNNQQPFRFPGLKLVNSTFESKAINSIKRSCIIMAGSGMCTGGRIKHHLVQNISRPESTILFVGYQAKGTLGRQILEGQPQVRIHGQSHPVRAKIAKINSFSAHADRNGLENWLKHFKTKPKRIFLTHGEKDVALNFANYLKNKKGLSVNVPEYLQEWDL